MNSSIVCYNCGGGNHSTFECQVDNSINEPSWYTNFVSDFYMNDPCQNDFYFDESSDCSSHRGYHKSIDCHSYIYGGLVFLMLQVNDQTLDNVSLEF